VPATFGKERLAFSMERSSNTLSQQSRFGQQVIEMPERFSKYGRLERIHGDREYLNAIGTPE